MDLEKLRNDYLDDGYTMANALAKICQDIILSKISKSSLNRSVTIKGGVVMHNISGDKRRATRNLDIDFIKHLLEILKDFFRRILLSKNEVDKDKTINILKECYEKDLYNSYDLIDISKDTDKEIEVNDFIKEEMLEKEYDYFD